MSSDSKFAFQKLYVEPLDYQADEFCRKKYVSAWNKLC